MRRWARQQRLSCRVPRNSVGGWCRAQYGLARGAQLHPDSRRGLAHLLARRLGSSPRGTSERIIVQQGGGAAGAAPAWQELWAGLPYWHQARVLHLPRRQGPVLVVGGE